MSIYCIGGAPLSGKTTLAKLLAKELCTTWISTDTVRSWMQELVEKNKFQDLFYGHKLSAEEFYSIYKTPETVFEMENRQSKDVQKGISALIKSDAYWDNLVIEGIAITPEYVNWLMHEYPDKNFIPVFLTDSDESRIKDRLYTRGLWDDAHKYPDYIKPIEFEWTKLYTDFYICETKKYGYPCYQTQDNVTETVNSLIKDM